MAYKVIHTYTSSRKEDQKDTWEMVGNLRKHLTTLNVYCRDSNLWPNMLRDIWWGQNVILLEQDVSSSIQSVFSLIECKHPRCTIPYLLNGEINSIYNMRDNKRIEISDDKEFCEYSGLGLVKISNQGWPEDRINLGSWKTMDQFLSGYMIYDEILNDSPNKGWHIHRPPATHNHVSKSQNQKIQANKGKILSLQK